MDARSFGLIHGVDAPAVNQWCRQGRLPGAVKLKGRWVVPGHLPRPTVVWESDYARFVAKVELLKSGCWRWVAGLDRDGYGLFKWGGKTRKAYRWVYEYAVAPIPSGLTIDHLCRNRWCVNPKHLEAVTNATNVLRGDGPSAHNARKTHCKRGHLLGGENVYVNLAGARICRSCMRWHNRRWRDKQGLARAG
jgi:hypothetical protein